MTDYPWTPAALYKLHLWLPKEARPEGLGTEYIIDDANGRKHFCGWGDVTTAHAVMLHEASVMRRLHSLGYAVDTGIFEDGNPYAEISLDREQVCHKTGPTLLHALVAAFEGLRT